MDKTQLQLFKNLINFEYEENISKIILIWK